LLTVETANIDGSQADV